MLTSGQLLSWIASRISGLPRCTASSRVPHDLARPAWAAIALTASTHWQHPWFAYPPTGSTAISTFAAFRRQTRTTQVHILSIEVTRSQPAELAGNEWLLCGTALTRHVYKCFLTCPAHFSFTPFTKPPPPPCRSCGWPRTPNPARAAYNICGEQ